MDLHARQVIHHSWLVAAGGDLRIVEAALAAAGEHATEQGAPLSSTMVLERIAGLMSAQSSAISQSIQARDSTRDRTAHGVDPRLGAAVAEMEGWNCLEPLRPGALEQLAAGLLAVIDAVQANSAEAYADGSEQPGVYRPGQPLQVRQERRSL